MLRECCSFWVVLLLQLGDVGRLVCSETVSTLFPRPPGSVRIKSTNAVVEWNLALQWSIRDSDVPAVEVRSFALESLAVWQAVQQNYAFDPPANETAVIASAAHSIMMNLLPQYHYQYDTLYLLQTAGLSFEDLLYAQAIGAGAAVNLLATRLNDGSQDVLAPPPDTAPPGGFRAVSQGDEGNFLGRYQTTQPMCLTIPQLLEVIDTFPAPPYTYPDDAYNTQLRAVNLLGEANSTLRQPSQTDTALFWATEYNVIGQWNQVALATLPADANLNDTAQFMALLNVAMFDSVVAAFRIKYNYNIWRPISALRTGDEQNPPQPDWTPLLPTPNNPSYPGSQPCVAGAAEIILQTQYGTDDFTYVVGTTARSNETALPNRVYNSFSKAAKEVAESRYLSGTEFIADSLAGLALGNQVAEECLTAFELL